MLTRAEAEAIASLILEAGDRAASIRPITDDRPDCDLAAAYDVSRIVAARRVARGERIVGWKIGFTNRTIWDEYGVHAPIWGPIYAETAEEVDPAAFPAPLIASELAEPRIEPEIGFRIARPLSPEMDERALLACIDAVTHGFEFVQSIFPGWRFRAADTVAAFALHGRYRHAPPVPIEDGARRAWLAKLTEFEIALFRDGQEVDRGQAKNVLDGPLSALRHFIRGLREFPDARGVKPGDIVTTGTVTRAFPVKPGERWSTELIGLPLPAMDVAIS